MGPQISLVIAALLGAAVTCPAATREVTPQSGLQAAVNGARAGDTLVLLPGVYYESVVITNSGTAQTPITIKAAQGGTAMISGAVPQLVATPPRFVRVDGDLYRAEVAQPVRWLMAGNRLQYRYANLESLRQFQGRRAPGDGPAEGFCWADKQLYVRLAGGQDPAKVRLEIARPATTPNLKIKADHIIIEGLRLHMAGRAPAVKTAGKNVTVRDCFIDGTQLGIDNMEGGAGLTVEFCEFSGFPLFEWQRWESVYDFAAFLRTVGPDVKVRHNLSYDVFDGYGFHDGGDGQEWSDISYNLLLRGIDDAFEFDSKRPLRLRAHHNVVIDTWVVFSMAATLGGDLVIDHNVGYLAAGNCRWDCTFFKFMNPWPSTRGQPTKNCMIVHNTLINRIREKDPKTDGGLYWTDGGPFRDMVLENNLFYSTKPKQWGLNAQGFTPSHHNLHAGPQGVPEEIRPDMIFARDPGIVSLNPLDFRLKPGSPAVDAGAANASYHQQTRGQSPDLGALELDENWKFPRPGPHWADAPHAVAHRPPLDASFDLRQAGFTGPAEWSGNGRNPETETGANKP